ncbi:DNA-protecting protein DprA [Acerihabitans arboris]|uniref:DNA-protecting protein DprA n=1 Tax=Acerihabitans arboris TaxID=2691583 RepID=A0A845SYR4_9GAMM|nr:DNA-protecting protein DprA [Acerihabitans arboris]NDL65955.1 DNA-protecting protein DprA [Acerihabitans arboris]
MTIMEMWLRMAAVKGVNGAKVHRCLSQLSLPGDFSPQPLLSACLTPAQRQRFQQYPGGDIEAALRWLEHPLHHIVTFADSGYPESLKALACPPPALFVLGDVACLASPQLAMVGSRQCTRYGEQWGGFFAADLAGCGITITSGLALGIDGICHRSALDAKGRTIAVLGSGLQNVYPSQHRRLAERITAYGGALVSEFALNAAPLAGHFPYRNRIISGLSRGVLVVEAAARSGSLVTARYALDQGKDVYALPGPLGNPASAGTHWLIQQGAYLVTQPKEVLEQLGGGLNWLPLTRPEIISAPECEVELPFADVLANVGDEVTPVDVVAERAGQSVPEVVSKLLELELAGWIAVVPGGYVRLRRAGHVRRSNVLV